MEKQENEIDICENAFRCPFFSDTKKECVTKERAYTKCIDMFLEDRAAFLTRIRYCNDVIRESNAALSQANQTIKQTRAMVSEIINKYTNKETAHE